MSGAGGLTARWRSSSPYPTAPLHRPSSSVAAWGYWPSRASSGSSRAPCPLPSRQVCCRPALKCTSTFTCCSSPEGPSCRPVPAVPRRHRAGPVRRAGLLKVDGAAFAPFWRLDRAGLREAVKATRQHHLRVALGDRRAVVGYAICGTSGSRGFVQRLAVSPATRGRGIGKALLLDGLHWLRAAGAARDRGQHPGRQRPGPRPLPPCRFSGRPGRPGGPVGPAQRPGRVGGELSVGRAKTRPAGPGASPLPTAGAHPPRRRSSLARAVMAVLFLGPIVLMGPSVAAGAAGPGPGPSTHNAAAPPSLGVARGHNIATGPDRLALISQSAWVGLGRDSSSCTWRSRRATKRRKRWLSSSMAGCSLVPSSRRR